MRLSAVASTAKPERAPLVIKGGTLIDGTGSPPIPNATVVARGNKFETVGSAAFIEEPADAYIVDVTGKTILPGLIDLHVHVAGAWMLSLLLGYGVTTVRDTGGFLSRLQRYDRKLASNTTAGPRLFYCGHLLDGENPMWAFSRVIRSRADAVREVELLARGGAWGVKTYIRLPPGLLATVVEEAHQRNLLVTGHLGLCTALEAVAAGIDGIEHIESIRLEDLVPDYAGGDWRKRRLDWGSVDLSSPKVRDTVARLSASGVYVDPTLVVFEKQATGDTSGKDADGTRLVPIGTQWGWSGQFRRNEDAIREFQRMQELVTILHDRGVRIVVGTDTPNAGVVPGLSLHRELELLVQAGLSPLEAIVAATKTNAQALGKQTELGTVEAGKLADLIVVDGDPTVDITATRNVELVIKDGQLIRPAALREIQWQADVESLYNWASFAALYVSSWFRSRKRK